MTPINAEPPGIVRPAADVKAELQAAFAAFEDHGRRRLEYALRIGQILAEAKRQCGHGNWLKWLEGNFAYGRQRAADFIRVHLERGKCSHLATFEEALQSLRASALHRRHRFPCALDA